MVAHRHSYAINGYLSLPKGGRVPLTQWGLLSFGAVFGYFKNFKLPIFSFCSKERFVCSSEMRRCAALQGEYPNVAHIIFFSFLHDAAFILNFFREYTSHRSYVRARAGSITFDASDRHPQCFLVLRTSLISSLSQGHEDSMCYCVWCLGGSDACCGFNVT